MFNDLDRWLTALCLYREASSQTYSAMLGKAFVIRNRTLRQSWEGKTPAEVVTKKDQFSSMTFPGDPNLTRWPIDPEDKAWIQAQQAALAALSEPPIAQRDPSGGAEFYFDFPLNEPPAAWGPVKLTAVINSTKFWARDETVPKETT